MQCSDLPRIANEKENQSDGAHIPYVGYQSYRIDAASTLPSGSSYGQLNQTYNNRASDFCSL
jgi:hypothetical protein